MSSIPEWSREDDKRFELALMLFPEGSSPDFLVNIANYIQKPIDEVEYCYLALINDVKMIEYGEVPLTKYPEDEYVSLAEASTQCQQKKGTSWTEDEHRLFLEGLDKYGKGDWKTISRECVKTRTPTQVASHAQKYFHRQESGGKGKRSSIHDITLESTTGKPDFGKQNPSDDDGSQGSYFGL